MGHAVILGLLRSPLGRLSGGLFTDPRPVRVQVRGTALAGTGRLIRHGDADRVALEHVYRQRFPKATLSANDPMLLIEPTMTEGW